MIPLRRLPGGATAVLILAAALAAAAAEAAAAAAVQEDDVRCLRGVKDALSDPAGSLSWNFSNSTVGFVCSFSGVSCWNPQENRVLGLALASMSLSGPVPSALQYCRAATSLDLSGNQISGSIPSALCSWLPYLVNLDLSGNILSGPIPPELSACRFLNTLSLYGNQLSGSIPGSLGRLDRLHHLDLSRNRLSGPIPDPLGSQFDSSAFDGNSGLCGRPLSSCGGSSLSHTSLIIIVAAGILGAAASLLLAYAIWRWCFSPRAKRFRRRASPAGGEVEDGLRWAERLRTSHYRLVPVSLFQKPIVKVKLADLLAATSVFHPDHIVTAGSAQAGTSYKAVLPDGSALTVKRLNDCPLQEKQFRAEMGRIGQLRHPNLVPLLGFCIVEDERLLIYKHMPNGALAASIHSLEWLERCRIGVGAARGLAWLHHGFQVPFIHQSLSSNAVLLDEDYEPRITDFGLARLVNPTSSAVDGFNTSPFTNGDLGELGYMAPEYATNPIASMKGDVYAFGVVLLELATGQKATEVTIEAAGEIFKGSLVDWVIQLSVAGRIIDAIDKSIRGRGHDNEIAQFLTIACGCVVARPKERPAMHQVYDSLKSVGEGHDYSEQFDEFPLIYGKDETEAV